MRILYNRLPSLITRFQKIQRLLKSQSRCLHLSNSLKTGTTEPGKFEVCTISDSMVDPCKPEPAVVIIGAGIAGLSAAQRLSQCGISNFTILEATDRPGGRIHSCWLGDVIAEMGCQFIRGSCMANPVYNLACQEGLLTPPVSRTGNNNYATDLYCTSDGRAIDIPVTVTAYHAFRRIQNDAQSLFAAGASGAHGSLNQFLALRIQQELQNFPEDQRYDASRVMYGLTSGLRTELGADLNDISADNFGSLIQIPGGQVRVPLGFVGVLAPLLRELPDCSLKYCKPVGNIQWGAVQQRAQSSGESTPRAVVTCCDGDAFCADYVLVTVSLGVLKQHADKLFCPQLPQEKTEAIKNLGFGKVNKIFLDYAKPFWVWREGGIKFAWSADEVSNRCDWTRGISGIEEVEGSKHVLSCLVSGKEAEQMERATDEEVAASITKLLRQFTGDASLPFPNTVLRSRWASDPYFCGSYSFMGINSTVGHQCDLSCPLPGPCDPVPPTLLFAGEATCAGHYSTAHGARLSGIREAERIIQLTKRYGGPPPAK